MMSIKRMSLKPQQGENLSTVVDSSTTIVSTTSVLCCSSMNLIKTESWYNPSRDSDALFTEPDLLASLVWYVCKPGLICMHAWSLMCMLNLRTCCSNDYLMPTSTPTPCIFMHNHHDDNMLHNNSINIHIIVPVANHVTSLYYIKSHHFSKHITSCIQVSIVCHCVSLTVVWAYTRVAIFWDLLKIANSHVTLYRLYYPM